MADETSRKVFVPAGTEDDVPQSLADAERVRL